MELGITLGRSSSEFGALGLGLRFLGCWCLGKKELGMRSVFGMQHLGI